MAADYLADLKPAIDANAAIPIEAVKDVPHVIVSFHFSSSLR